MRRAYLHDTLDHVLYVRTDRLDGGELLTNTEPLLNHQLVLLYLLYVD